MKNLQPKRYPKNSPQVKGVGNGEISIGWVNHYYLMRQLAVDPEYPAANYLFPTPGDAGNLLMLSGVAVSKHSKKQALADEFVKFLLSDEIQTHFTQVNFEYPLVGGVKAAAGLEPLGDRLSLIDQKHLTDIAKTQEVLQSLGLR